MPNFPSSQLSPTRPVRTRLRAAARLVLAGLTVLAGALPIGGLERPAAAATSDPVLVGAGGIA